MGEDHVLAGDLVDPAETGDDSLAVVDDDLQLERADVPARFTDTHRAVTGQFARTLLEAFANAPDLLDESASC